MALTAVAVWTMTLLSRWPGISVGLQISSLQHAYFMTFGLLSPFMCGFIFTAGPRWLNQPEPGKRWFGGVAGLALLAGLLFLLTPWQGVAGGLLCLMWAAICVQWWMLVATSPVPERRHGVSVGLAFTMAFLGATLGLPAVIGADASYWRLSLALGTWTFLMPVFLTVSHRMLPFFSTNVIPQYEVWRPYWLLLLWWGSTIAMAVGDLTQWRMLTLVTALIYTASLAYCSWRWRLIASFTNKLLAMLHLSFAWAAVGMALFAIDACLTLSGKGSIALEARHALNLGFFLTMMSGFVTRVSFGHSGRPLQATPGTWALYFGFHAAALARLIGGFYAPAGITLSAVILLVVLTLWVGYFWRTWAH